MAEIKPFRGTLYSSDAIGGSYAAVMAPPYDVISESMREKLHQESPFNIIRLILGKASDGDDALSNVYTRAGQTLGEWQKEKVLVKDEKPCFYVYMQEYLVRGEKFRRAGFLGLMKIEGEDMVVPHEKTHSKPKEDRLNLITEVECNLSPIFTLYEDEGMEVKQVIDRCILEEDPAIDIEIDGVTHKLWRLEDDEDMDRISSAMKSKKVFIADGHHRYEVARTYRDKKREEENYDGYADNVLMYFAAMDPANLTVLATHRAIKKLPDLKESELIEKLSKYFEIIECRDLSDLMGRLDEKASESYYYGFFGGEKYVLLRPLSEVSLRGLIDPSKKEEWKDLDVSVLHAAVFSKILSLKEAEGTITYVKDAEDGVSLVGSGTHSCVFYMNPTKMDQLKKVAEAGEVMPQKSTYFYPKLLTGLVINKFEGSKVKA